MQAQLIDIPNELTILGAFKRLKTLIGLIIAASMGAFAFIYFDIPFGVVCAALVIATCLPLTIVYPKETFLGFLIVRNMVDITSAHALVSVGGIALNASAMMGIAFIVWGMWYFITFWPIPKFSGNLTLYTFLAAGLISVITSIQPMHSAEEYIKFLNLAFAFVIAYDITATKKDMIAVIRAVAYAIIVPAMVAYYQLVTNTGLHAEINNRVFGTYGHPNTFAFALVLTIAGWAIYAITSSSGNGESKAAHTMQQSPPARISKKYLLMMLMLGAILLFTYTRAAWVGIMAIGIVYGLRFHRAITLMGGIIIMLILISFPLLRNTVNDITGYDMRQNQMIMRLSGSEEDTTSIAWRFRSWNEVSIKLKSMPPFGYGVGMFQQVRESTISYATDLRALEAHNDYLRLAIEMGYLGAFTYTVFLIVMVVKCITASKNAPDLLTRKQFTIAAACALAFMVMSMTDNILRGTAVGWLFWAMMGSMIAYATKSGYCGITKYW